MGIIGMEFPAATFFLLVLLCLHRTSSQVISECQVPFDFAAFRLKAVKLKFPMPGRWLIERAEPPASNAVFAPTSVAELQEDGLLLIQLNDALHHRQQIDNGFAQEAGDSC